MNATEPAPTEPAEPATEPQEAPREPEPVNPDAEPVEPIEGPGEDDTPPEEPEQPSGMSDREREAQQKDLEKEAKRHENKVTAILGSDAEDVTECPFCDPLLRGYFYDAQLATPRSEMQAAMISALQGPPEAVYLPAADVEQCQSCDGYGKTLTGSRVPGNEHKACANCKGFGFYPPPGSVSNGQITQDEAHELVLAGGSPLVQDDSDPWGSPRLLTDGQENPNYGKMPQFKNPQLP